MPDRAQIVRDEQVRQVPLLLKALDQIQNLRLDRDVQRRDRLVGDDEIGIGGERARNADALLLAAGKLVRIAVDEARAQPDGFHQLLDARPLLLTAREAEWLNRLG